MINTVILNVFILRFFCVIRGGGGDDELRSGSLFSSYMALCFIVMSGVVEFSLRFNLFPRHEVCGEFRVLFCRFAFIGFV